MTCQSCLQKWIDYYKLKGFYDADAFKMAKKLLKRLDKRVKQEPEGFVALYLLKKAGEGIIQYWGEPSRFEKVGRRLNNLLKRWVFHTNWRATFLWSFKYKRIVWIGRHIGLGTNPDYTQACVQSTCALTASACFVGEYCLNAAACVALSPCASTGGCNCTSPLPNSSQVSGCTKSCGTAGVCACVGHACTIGTCTISNCTTGTCGYNCDTGYTWNGSACVIAGAAAVTKAYGDGLVWIVR